MMKRPITVTAALAAHATLAIIIILWLSVTPQLSVTRFKYSVAPLVIGVIAVFPFSAHLCAYYGLWTRTAWGRVLSRITFAIVALVALFECLRATSHKAAAATPAFALSRCILAISMFFLLGSEGTKQYFAEKAEAS